MIDIDYNNRQLIPRLLPFRTSNLLSLNLSGKIDSKDCVNDVERHNYFKLKMDWLSEKDLVSAIHILSYEIFFEDLTSSVEVLDFLKLNRSELNCIELEILNLALRQTNSAENDIELLDLQDDNSIVLKQLRNQNRLDTYNPMIWCDIGYYYAAMGLLKKAERAYRVAVSLNNSNKYIVRSAARFFLHIDEPEIALDILIKSPRFRYDPSLVSAEIAISELIKKNSAHSNVGKKLVADESISINEKNELLAQLATLEFSYGKQSLGKKFVKECLIAPNENSLAQFEYLSSKFPIDNHFNSSDYNVLFLYEALARNNFAKMNFEQSFQNSLQWFGFQPISSKPAILASYIAATVLEKFDDAINIIRRALKSSPDNHALQNNLAFSLARSGRLIEAQEEMDKIHISGLATSDKAVLNATEGFISIQSGNLSVGVESYKKAFEFFKMENNEIMLARAYYFFCRAIKPYLPDDYAFLIKEVERLSKKNSIVELSYLLGKESLS